MKVLVIVIVIIIFILIQNHLVSEFEIRVLLDRTP